MRDEGIQVHRSETLGEEVHFTCLPGRLPVYFCPKPGFRKKYACYSTFYGSVDSSFLLPGAAAPRTVPDGIAHFLEHTLFETPLGNVSDLFARNGAYNNALTSFSTTTYLFASSDRFYDNLRLLVDFVENPVFDPAKVEKERGIIEQEILRYQDDPGWVGYMGLLESLFANHPVRIDIAGTVESIARVDAATLHECHRVFYRPDNMILFVIGDLDRGEVFDFVRSQSRHGAAPGHDGEPPEVVDRLYPEEPFAVASERFERAMDVALPKLLVGFKETGVPLTGPELLRRELITEFALDLLFGRGSDAYLELYTSDLVLDDFSASYQACAGVGAVVMGGETPAPDGLLTALEGWIDRVRSGGLDEASYERQKRKFIGGFVRSFNSLEFIASNYTYHRFYDLDLFGVVDVLQSIGKSEVEERIRGLFDSARRSTSLITPLSRAPGPPGPAVPGP